MKKQTKPRTKESTNLTQYQKECIEYERGIRILRQNRFFGPSLESDSLQTITEEESKTIVVGRARCQKVAIHYCFPYFPKVILEQIRLRQLLISERIPFTEDSSLENYIRDIEEYSRNLIKMAEEVRRDLK